MSIFFFHSRSENSQLEKFREKIRKQHEQLTKENEKLARQLEQVLRKQGKEPNEYVLVEESATNLPKIETHNNYVNIIDYLKINFEKF